MTHEDKIGQCLEYWTWERLKPMLLKRYDTTEEEILDYRAYRISGSEERYIRPRDREEARKQGIRFWEGEA